MWQRGSLGKDELAEQGRAASGAGWGLPGSRGRADPLQGLQVRSSGIHSQLDTSSLRAPEKLRQGIQGRFAPSQTCCQAGFHVLCLSFSCLSAWFSSLSTQVGRTLPTENKNPGWGLRAAPPTPKGATAPFQQWDLLLKTTACRDPQASVELQGQLKKVRQGSCF